MLACWSIAIDRVCGRSRETYEHAVVTAKFIDRDGSARHLPYFVDACALNYAKGEAAI
jgi:hypothetical protein